MKEIFFKGLVVALPVMVIGGLVYMIFHGFYALYSDMRLKRELEQIKRESVRRRRDDSTEPAPRNKPSAPEDFFS